MAQQNAIIRFLSALWSGADAVRKVLHLVLLLFLFGVFFGAVSGTAPSRLPGRAALVIEPSGVLVEQLAGDPFDRAVAELVGESEPQTVVQDVVDALAYARDDDGIEIVYFELSSLFGGGLSKLQRIADAIEDFRSSGKEVIASADYLSQPAYYLAAHADQVYLNPEGLVWIRGYGAYRNYYKDAIDLLRIDWNVFRVGTHKSYVEPYTRTNMSDEDRETRERLVTQLWALYQEGVVAARGLDDGVLDAFTGDLLESTLAAGGDLAQVAVQYGLVDELLERTEIRQRLIARVGEDPDRPDSYRSASMYEYLQLKRLLEGSKAGDENVAVVIAAGEIMFGDQPPGSIGGDSTAALLRKARNDDSVRAVVLRVDSPGGSSFASEIIAAEIRALQNDGIPVVASMSSVAASGGYVIAMDADRIFAGAATITGSIGVFGMFPTFQRTLDAVGITGDGVGSTPWSGELRVDREMSDDAKALFQASIEEIYDDFISGVASNRGMDKADVDRIAQGRVYTGGEALEIGLVDELGELDAAIEAAARLAELDGYGIINVERQLSGTEQFIVDLLGVASRAGVDVDAFSRRPSAVEALAGNIASQAVSLLRFNDPKGVYAHCLCEMIN